MKSTGHNENGDEEGVFASTMSPIRPKRWRRRGRHQEAGGESQQRENIAGRWR